MTIRVLVVDDSALIRNVLQAIINEQSDMQVVGSAHSHPSGVLTPSKPDIQFFAHTGDYNIIVGPPFDLSSWACYDVEGLRRDLPILDVDFKDDGFDDDFDDEFD